jgi:alkanesulfonate monooxygenase SsuD/methylene tetrahydromethanopterin reductase-like flavin-dependent oxidoreductase (luciferase family)
VEWDDVRSAALEAEELGLDSVWVVDHLQSMAPDLGLFEAWTVLSALASATKRVELGAQVFCQSFRNPALFAKMAATLDRVSGGRFRLLMGAGWYEDEYVKYGYDFPSAGVLVERLRETVTILHGMLSGKDEPFTFEGAHYRVAEVRNLPQPIHAPLPIEIGGARDRVLRTVARQGDGWNCPPSRSAGSTTAWRSSAPSARRPAAPSTSSG